MCTALQKPGSVDEPLIDESQGFLARACKRMYTGKTALEPDVILKLGDDMLPAHRCLLAESSDFYRTMFQASSSCSQGCCRLACVSLERSYRNCQISDLMQTPSAARDVCWKGGM